MNRQRKIYEKQRAYYRANPTALLSEQGVSFCAGAFECEHGWEKCWPCTKTIGSQCPHNCPSCRTNARLSAWVILLPAAGAAETSTKEPFAFGLERSLQEGTGALDIKGIWVKIGFETIEDAELFRILYNEACDEEKRRAKERAL